MKVSMVMASVAGLLSSRSCDRNCLFLGEEIPYQRRKGLRVCPLLPQANTLPVPPGPLTPPNTAAGLFSWAGTHTPITGPSSASRCTRQESVRKKIHTGKRELFFGGSMSVLTSKAMDHIYINIHGAYLTYIRSL